VLLTVVLSLGILVIWQYFFAPKAPSVPLDSQGGSGAEKRQGPLGEGEETASPGSQPAASQPAASQPAAEMDARAAAGGSRESNMEGTQETLKHNGIVATFTSRGAALRHLVLTDPRFKELREGQLKQVDLVRTPAGRGPWPLSATFPKSDFEVPAHAIFRTTDRSDREIRYVWESDKVKVSKHYLLDPVRPILWFTLEVANRTAAKLSGHLELKLYNRQLRDQAKPGFTNPYPVIPTVSCYANGEIQTRSMDGIRGKESGCTPAGCGMGSGPVNRMGEVLWIGSDERYFLTALVPQDRTEERRCELKALDEATIEASLLYPEVVLGPQKAHEFRFAVFVGPKDLKALDSVKGPTGAEGHLGDAIEFGWFAVLCRPMLWLMKIFYSWFHNWGVAIILLTVVVKLLTLYWTQKSMRSMKEMQRLKPKIDALRERYKDDKARLNQEMMTLYKVHRVNPLGGCLPMLIQMPVWFALYRTLGNAVELYRSHFLGWITDLTAPDQYYVLPIAMGVSMYAQQAITPQPMEGAQAKMMKYFMPGMFTVMMLALPSGLTLYIFVNTVLTMAHQWYMNKTDPHRNDPAEVRETKAAAQGDADPKARHRKRRKTRS
jgi:YidC/Oxa1 family membrane protein insertase